jgi:hypothetical protein
MAKAEADRRAIERWEDEGGASLPGDAQFLSRPMTHLAPMNQAQWREWI